MRVLENDTSHDFATTEMSMAPAQICSYKNVRFNAMKHGILSRLAVLAHEDHAEFDDLLVALMDEHRPAGMTERHLIEELATIIWRKRRVLLAEGAKINEGLKSVVNSPRSVMPSAAPFQRGLVGENPDLREFMEGTPEEIAERALDKIMHVGENAPPVIRDQALAFRDHIRQILVYYMGEAVKSDRTTQINKLRAAGHPELSKLLDE